ncbi:MAG: hypothetical protein FWF49_00035 [Oscillospiraceae bacterium]|nr:hypothetical protein [Oscillospiraceae bacterium]
MDKIVQRILTELGDDTLLQKLAALPQSDLNSLWLEINRNQSKKLTPPALLKNYAGNRFAVPSEISPLQYCQLETELFSLAQRHTIEGILLSPAAPFGSCSAFGCVDQNNVVSAVRGTEMVADPTNMLAIVIADRLKNRKIENKTPVHYCAAARAVRAQTFVGKRSFPHFGLFCIVSSGKDAGSYICEKSLLIKQLSYYKDLFFEKYNAELHVVLRKRSGYTDSDGFFEKMAELLQTELPDASFSFDLDHADNPYYKGLNFKLYMYRDEEKIEIGDGGFVDWIQQMTGNKKERCLISGIGLDRMILQGLI